MRIDILTLFPEMFPSVLNASILGKAQEKELVQFHLVNFRDYAGNKHGTVDDYPYGGGGGMVLKPEPIFAAIEALGLGVEAGQTQKGNGSSTPTANLEGDVQESARTRIILMCPQGEPLSQPKVEQFAAAERLVLICGHYEGYDERIRKHLVTDEVSIGDYVLTGGELPAMVLIDSVVRLLPGVLGNEQSSITDSFSTGLLEYPQYTRPAEYRGWKVPDVLLSGHHEHIAAWRRKQSLYRTWQRRPDLIDRRQLSAEDHRWLEEFEREHKLEKQEGR